jgi:hypothetical protein
LPSLVSLNLPGFVRAVPRAGAAGCQLGPDPNSRRHASESWNPAFAAAHALAFLDQDNRIYKPGSLILSGNKVYGLHKAGIITELLPSWRDEEPVLHPGEALQ